MLVLALLPTSLAFAVQDTGRCRGNVLIEHRPANLTEQVPYDARILLAFDRDGCSSSQITIEVDSDSDEFWSESLDFEPFTDLVAWLPEGGWTPGTEYLIRVDDDGEDGDTEDNGFGFTVGDAPSEPILTAPTITIYDAWAQERGEDAVFDVDLHVSSQPDALGLSLVQVFDVSDPTMPVATKFATGTGELEVAARLVGSADDVEVCLAALQIDATGQASELGPSTCVELTWTHAGNSGCGGCNSGVGVMGAGFLWSLAGCLIAFRREEDG
jgi:hypothetical protein